MRWTNGLSLWYARWGRDATGLECYGLGRGGDRVFGVRLIFIYGLPATGKLTVAKELQGLCGYRLFHNHLTVDLLLSTFEFGSEAFIRLREEIWLRVFEEAARSGVAGIIFTFNAEKTVRAGFSERVVELVEASGGAVSFVQLVCGVDELRRRMDSEARRQHGKLTSVTLFEQLEAAGEFDSTYMPEPVITVDTGECGPGEAARQIGRTLGLTSG